ncbi:hypothetical protein P7D22_13220 [Lichenihabitans sp. Uapishka_5]|uniref:hypothetical protein n=1 Tax=Lichenihabitans sp. Uapishka_5 TaxID=3037302 RepID=UPI0029E7CED8|nr:hypothetical protein [Lichenihabitans sp. Uapishka_5]MDX7952135.1 hypothetical protein [Lichenihabitans sp. Uapishka_5]
MWSEIGEVIKAVAPVFTAGAACFGAFIAYKGLEKWRVETVGRRRIELAEDVLADFYEAQDLFRWIRSPTAHSHESEGRPGRDQDPDDLRQHRDTFYVPFKRLSDSAEFFARLRARRYRVIATFGPDAASAYEDLHKVQVRIAVAAQALMRLRPGSSSERQVMREEKLERDVWEGYGDPDEIKNIISDTISEVEKRFRPEASKGMAKP